MRQAKGLDPSAERARIRSLPVAPVCAWSRALAEKNAGIPLRQTS